MMMKMSKTPQYYVPNLRPTYPEAAERDYYRLLRALVRELKKATEEHLSQIKSELRQDSTDDIIASIIAAFDKGGAKEEVIREINRIMASVDSTTKANIRKAFKATMQVDVYVDDSELLSTVQKEWYNQQYKLVNSIVSTYTDKLQTIVSNAVQRGSLYKDVQQEIKKLYNTTDTRAKFIAVNEVGNLNAITTKVRQQEAGISAYRWSTSKDERVRSSHKVNEGKLFFWNSSKAGKINGIDVLPSPAFHPGMDYRCRCVAIPVIDMESWNTRMVIPLGEVKPDKNTVIAPYRTQNFKFFERNEVDSIEEMYRPAEINYYKDLGLSVIVPTDLDKKKQILDEKTIVQVLKQMPKALVKEIKQVRLLDVLYPEDVKAIKMGKKVNPALAIAYNKNKSITIWQNTGENWGVHDIYYVLLHESGHILDFSNQFISLSDEWINAMLADAALGYEYVTAYGRTKIEEDFAESVAMYYTHKEQFKKAFPNRTAIIERLISDDKA